MSASSLAFYMLAAIILVFGLLSVTTRNLFRAAIWLLFSLAGIGGWYIWMRMEFLAAVQIIVYAGGIVVLILFSIFLTQQAGKPMPRPRPGRVIASALATIFGFALVAMLAGRYNFGSAGISAGTSAAALSMVKAPAGTDVAAIGTQLLSLGDQGYALPFELVSILLLAAMIGCIVIAIRTKTNEK